MARVLVVDDSAFMRKVIKDILNSDPSIEVVDTAHDGKDAVVKTQKLKPDVITMDLKMPVMDGIEAVKQIMSTNPTPIVILSAFSSKDAEITLDAMDAGAVDFIGKPSGSISKDLDHIGKEIIHKVKTAAHATVKTKKPITITREHPKIKVLIVDDSAFDRRRIKDIINRESDIEVIGEAKNGKEAIEKVKILRPDVVIMDIEMPEMDGVNTTFQILKKNPIPIIVFSGKTSTHMKDIKLTLELGAVDFIPKPLNQMSVGSIAPLFVKKIRDAHSIKIQRTTAEREAAEIENIVLIGSSTGGPQILTELVPQIPADVPAGILIVQHMPPIFTKSLAKKLDKFSSITIKEAKEGDEIKPGEALIAPGDYHMTVYEKKIRGIKKRFVSLDKDEKLHGVRPSVDVTFASAAKIFGSNTIGILLTGMGQDGANSMGLIKAKGGYTITQDEETSMIFGMPNAAIKLGIVDKVLPPHKISSHVMKILNSIEKKAAS